MWQLNKTPMMQSFAKRNTLWATLTSRQMSLAVRGAESFSCVKKEITAGIKLLPPPFSFYKLSSLYWEFVFLLMSPCIATLSFYDFPLVLKTLIFYDISYVLETLVFPEFAHVPETLRFYKLCPYTEDFVFL